MISTFLRFLRAASASMCSFWVLELENPVTLEPGSCSAKYSVADPQPHLNPRHVKKGASSRFKQIDLPQIKNAHPILQFGLGDVLLQHRRLCLSECFFARGEEAAGVLHARPEQSRKHFSGNFVLLCIGSLSLNGYRLRA